MAFKAFENTLQWFQAITCPINTNTSHILRWQITIYFNSPTFGKTQHNCRPSVFFDQQTPRAKKEYNILAKDERSLAGWNDNSYSNSSKPLSPRVQSRSCTQNMSWLKTERLPKSQLFVSLLRTYLLKTGFLERPSPITLLLFSFPGHLDVPNSKLKRALKPLLQAKWLHSFGRPHLGRQHLTDSLRNLQQVSWYIREMASRKFKWIPRGISTAHLFSSNIGEAAEICSNLNYNHE